MSAKYQPERISSSNNYYQNHNSYDLKTIQQFCADKNYKLVAPRTDVYYLLLHVPFNSHVSPEFASIRFSKNYIASNNKKEIYVLDETVYVGPHGQTPEYFEEKWDGISIEDDIFKYNQHLDDFVDYLEKRLVKRDKLRVKSHAKYLANQKKIKIADIGIIAGLNEIFNPVGLVAVRNARTHRIEVNTDENHKMGHHNLAGAGWGMFFDINEGQYDNRNLTKHVTIEKGYWVRFAIPGGTSYSYAFAKDEEAVYEIARMYVGWYNNGNNCSSTANWFFTGNNFMKEVKK